MVEDCVDKSKGNMFKSSTVLSTYSYLLVRIILLEIGYVSSLIEREGIGVYLCLDLFKRAG